jgi:hypothetical protein
MIDQQMAATLKDRLRTLEAWLQTEEAAYCSKQRHLDCGSEPRAYWHLGYLTALRDLSAATSVTAAAMRNDDTATPCHVVVPDGRHCPRA